MNIVGYKPNHDGGLALICDSALQFCLEAEKDGRARHSHIKPLDWLEFWSRLVEVPDVIAVGGWHPDRVTAAFPTISDPAFAYDGIDSVFVEDKNIFGRKIQLFASSHLRSHLLCAYGLSPLPQGHPCYVLIWEGSLGGFYRIGEAVDIKFIGSPLESPGLRYEYLYYLGSTDDVPFVHASTSSGPGKLMALAAFGNRDPLPAADRELVTFLLSDRAPDLINKSLRSPRRSLPFKGSIVGRGVESQAFKNVARAVSDAIWERYFFFARERLGERLPLLIAGGCGLNCEWNTRWKEGNLFTEVFIPPCANDSGSAIGTAIDAQFSLTGVAKIQWSPYAGGALDTSGVDQEGFDLYDLNIDHVAEVLAQGAVLAWAQGRCEIGPRALGNRSLLAAPFSADMTRRLNEIKERESYRPIAPVCCEGDVGRFFEWMTPSPYMLHFQRVKDPRLRAVTHVDGTARVQTVNERQNLRLWELLQAFSKKTGVPVLCNTSLNRKGCGFFNKAREIVEFVKMRDVDGAVINDKFYLKKGVGSKVGFPNHSSQKCVL